MSRPLHQHRLGPAAALVAVGGLCLTGLLAPPAAAAAPDNDLIASATKVRALPRTFDIDTTQATSSPDDGDGVGGHTVWFKYRAAESGRVRVTTIGSDYDTVLTLFEGPRDARTTLARNDDRIDLDAALQFRAVEGKRYWIAAGSCCGPRRGGGGDLHLTFHRPQPLVVNTALSSGRTGGISGRLMMSGEIASETPAAAYLVMDVNQRVGTRVARSHYEGLLDSPGPGPTDWTLVLYSETNVAFQPGDAIVTWSASPLDGFTWLDGVTQESRVTLTDDPAARQVPTG